MAVMTGLRPEDWIGRSETVTDVATAAPLDEPPGSRPVARSKGESGVP